MTATPFEQANRAALTTLATESTFIDQLLAANPGKATRQVLGKSAGGRDIYALVFGTGTAAPLLCINSVHGDETMPREAAMTLARDLCETTHPWAGLLAERKLYLVITGNPDGRQALTRSNSAGQDPNRHYLNRAAPESAIYAELIHAMMPAAIYDGHEWNGKPDDDCFVAMGNFSAIDPRVRAAQIAICEDLWDRLVDFGATVKWYSQPSPEGSFLHLGGLLGIPSFMMETAEEFYGDTSLYGRRHDRHRVALGAWLDHMAAHAGTYEQVGRAARVRMSRKTARGDYFWPINHHTPMPPGTWVGHGLSTAGGNAVTAASYTATNMPAVTGVLAANRIPHNPTTGHVPLDHDRAAIAAYLLDPTGNALGAATRNPPAPIAGAPARAHQPGWDLFDSIQA